MVFAVFQLRDTDGDGFGPFARQLFDLLQLLAQLPGILDFRNDLLGDFLITVEEVEQLLPDPVDQFSADLCVAQLVLGL